MTKIYYTNCQNAFKENLKDKKINKKLDVHGVRSVKKAIDLLQKTWFSDWFYREKMIAIVFNIIESVNHQEALLGVALCNFKEDQPILIAFESSESIVFYWKINTPPFWIHFPLPNDESVNNKQKITEFITSFLISELKEGRTGLKIHTLAAELNVIFDHRGYNLLMIASEEGNDVVVDFLLAQNFEIDYETNGFSAAYLAIEKNHAQVLLKLLKSSAKFPNNFIIDNLPSNIVDFVIESESLHKYIKSNNVEFIKETSEILERNRLEKIPLKNFYNTENISAAFAAIKAQNVANYKTLVENQITMAPTEVFDKLNIPEKVKKNIRKFNSNHVKELPRNYLNILKGKSKAAVDNQVKEVHRRLIDDAYDTLNGLAFVRIILEIAASALQLEITFDFNHDSTIFMDPMAEKLVEGTYLYDGKILIAAKKLLNEETKHEVYGVIAHELCHLSMDLVFRNKCKPFSKDDKNGEESFSKVLELCRDKKHMNEIIGMVFKDDTYKEEVREAELIVRVVHLYAHNYQYPCKIARIRKTFEKLFTFYEVTIKFKLENALRALKILEDPKEKIRYSDLSDDLKMTVKNSEVVFLGIKIVLNSLTDELKFYEQLKSEEIKLLVKGGEIKIGQALNEFESFITRKFLVKNNPLPVLFEELVTIPSEHLKILVDVPGVGKSAFFVQAAFDLLQKYPHKWVILIDLKMTANIFKDKESWSLEEIKILLTQSVLKVTDMSLSLFNLLFDAGKVIIFWDSLERISLEAKASVMKIFEILVSSSKVTQWIAAGKDCEFDLERTFSQTSFSLVELDHEETIKLLLLFKSDSHSAGKIYSSLQK